MSGLVSVGLISRLRLTHWLLVVAETGLESRSRHGKQQIGVVVIGDCTELASLLLTEIVWHSIVSGLGVADGVFSVLLRSISMVIHS